MHPFKEAGASGFFTARPNEEAPQRFEAIRHFLRHTTTGHSISSLTTPPAVAKRHFVGYCVENKEARESSAIQSFDSDTAVGVTSSGRRPSVRHRRDQGCQYGIHGVG